MAKIRTNNGKVILIDEKASCNCCNCSGCKTIEEIAESTSISIGGYSGTFQIPARTALVEEPFSDYTYEIPDTGNGVGTGLINSTLCSASNNVEYFAEGIRQGTFGIGFGISRIDGECKVTLYGDYIYVPAIDFSVIASGTKVIEINELIGGHLINMPGQSCSTTLDDPPVTTCVPVNITASITIS